MYGSYPRIESGSCCESFNDLLGAPCDILNFEDSNKSIEEKAKL